MSTITEQDVEDRYQEALEQHEAAFERWQANQDKALERQFFNETRNAFEIQFSWRLVLDRVRWANVEPIIAILERE